MTAYVLVFHNSDYANSFERLFSTDFAHRKSAEAFQIKADVMLDTRDTWFFKGLSLNSVNKLL